MNSEEKKRAKKDRQHNGLPKKRKKPGWEKKPKKASTDLGGKGKTGRRPKVRKKGGEGVKKNYGEFRQDTGDYSRPREKKKSKGGGDQVGRVAKSTTSLVEEIF